MPRSASKVAPPLPWVDFVSFDPRVRKPQLFIRRFEPDRAEVERIEAGAREFLAELEAMEKQLEAA